MMSSYSEKRPILDTSHSQPVTWKLIFSISTAVLGMLQFGYNTSVVNAPQALLQDFYNSTYLSRHGEPMPSSTNTILWSFTVSIMAIGGMVGAIIGAWWADKFGRKRGMMVNSFIGIVSGLVMGTSKVAASYELLIIGRLMVGFNCGLYTGLAPIYNSEISPHTIRGAVGTINQLAVTVGLLLGQVLGLEEALGTQNLWPLLFGLAAFPCLLQLLMLLWCPESPRYLLIAQNDETAASKALQDLRGSDEVGEELDEMIREQQYSGENMKLNMWQVITSPHLRLPLLVSVFMHLSQQLSGINCIFFYSVSLFQSVGLSELQAKYANLAVGSIMVVMTLVSVPLMDRAGRRSLHLIGLAGMFILSVVFTISFKMSAQAADSQALEYVTISSALLIVVFFAIGPGSIPWMIVAELFAQGARASAVNIGVLVNWSASFLVGLVFPSMLSALKQLVFVPFTVLLLIFFILLFKYLPETKGKTIEEITLMFTNRPPVKQETSNIDSDSTSSTNI